MYLWLALKMLKKYKVLHGYMTLGTSLFMGSARSTLNCDICFTIISVSQTFLSMEPFDFKDH